MIRSTLTKSFLVFLAIIAFTACSEQKKRRVLNFPKTDLSAESLIPKPLKIIATENGFALDQYTAIYTSQNATGFEEVGKFLATKIKAQTDLDMQVNVAGHVRLLMRAGRGASARSSYPGDDVAL